MIKIFTLIIILASAVLRTLSTNNYGAFNMSLAKFEFCKGPKVKDCCLGTTKLDNDTTVEVDMVVNEDVIPLRGKVVASSTTNTDTMRLLLNKPCEHLLVKPMLQALFGVNNKCVVPKGHYQFRLNFKDMVQNYFGGKHFYGSWKFKSLFYNNNCNFVCTLTEINLNPA